MASKSQKSLGIRMYKRDARAIARRAAIVGLTPSMWCRKLLIAELTPDDYVEESPDTRSDAPISADQRQLAPIVEEVLNEPEDAAQEGDADVVRAEGLVYQADAAAVSQEATGFEVVEVLVSQESGQSAGSSRRLDSHDADSPKQPLTYRRQDLCKRCQRIGPCCPECRAKTRNRVPE